MEPADLSSMRLKQVAVTNGLILTVIIIFFFVTNLFTITFAHVFLALGVLILIQAISGLIKGDTTKSIIPIFEKVAIYEKQKMGSEWYKQRKVGYIWNLVLSGLMFLQYYWNRDSPDNAFQIDLLFLCLIAFLLLVLINISLIIHFRKVDTSTSELDMKGYTWKSNLVAVAAGIIFALIIFVITLIYIISGI